MAYLTFLFRKHLGDLLGFRKLANRFRCDGYNMDMYTSSVLGSPLGVLRWWSAGELTPLAVG
jgi:hypothetical protein